jgi:hypothetical protein
LRIRGRIINRKGRKERKIRQGQLATKDMDSTSLTTGSEHEERDLTSEPSCPSCHRGEKVITVNREAAT